MRTVAGTSHGTVALERSAQWIAERLRTIGMSEVTITRRHGPPAVVAVRPGTRRAPTLLLYAHHDVVDASSFDAVRTGTLLRGRGASDDKGPLVALLHGIARYLKSSVDGTARNEPGLVVVIDGEEEVGSPHLAGLLRSARAVGGPVDAVLAIDTQADRTGQPALTVSLRGQTSVDLDIHGPPERHSGRFGGKSSDPGLILAAILSALATTNGRVRPVDDGSFSVAVNALCTNQCSVGPHHVIPSMVRAKLNFRFDRTDGPSTWNRLAVLSASHLRCDTHARITPWLSVRPWSLATGDHRLVAIVTEVLTEHFGAPQRLQSTATLPLASVVEDVLGVHDIALIGFGQATDNAHAPNEQVDLIRLAAMAAAVVDVLRAFGESR